MKNGKSFIRLIGALGILSAMCGSEQPGSSGNDPDLPGSIQLKVACPGNSSDDIPTAIHSLEWKIFRIPSEGVLGDMVGDAITVARAALLLACAGTTSTLASASLPPGHYRSIVTAKNAAAVTVNDESLATNDFTVVAGENTAVSAKIKAAARGVGLIVDIDADSFTGSGSSGGGGTGGGK